MSPTHSPNALQEALYRAIPTLEGRTIALNGTEYSIQDLQDLGEKCPANFDSDPGNLGRYTLEILELDNVDNYIELFTIFCVAVFSRILAVWILRWREKMAQRLKECDKVCCGLKEVGVAVAAPAGTSFDSQLWLTNLLVSQGATVRRKQELLRAVTDRESFAKLVQQKPPVSGPDGDLDVFNPLQMSAGDGGDMGGIELNDMRVR